MAQNSQAPAGTTRRHALLVMAGAAFALGACAKRKPDRTAIPRNSIVLALGNSVTYGTGAAAGEDWPTLLAQKTRWDIVNAGVPGDTAQTCKERVEVLLTQHQPALVIVEIGGNDFLHHRTPAQIKEDIRQIIRRIQNKNIPLALVAVPAPPSFSGLLTQNVSDADLYAELAKEENVALIANVFSETLSTKEWRADQIHPNAQGYAHMAQGIHDALRSQGFL